MQSNRFFLRRAARYLVSRGSRNSWISARAFPPSVMCTRSPQQADSQARVVYVDNDPVAVSHSRAILARTDRTAVVHADLRDPESILEHPLVMETIGLDRPVALLMVAVLHFVPDEDDPFAALSRIRDGLALGSHLVLSHAGADGRPEVA